ITHEIAAVNRDHGTFTLPVLQSALMGRLGLTQSQAEEHVQAMISQGFLYFDQKTAQGLTFIDPSLTGQSEPQSLEQYLGGNDQ
ncbi:MAG: hypothetical protein AAF647_05545, partial [Pseudomonadota bacterium]